MSTSYNYLLSLHDALPICNKTTNLTSKEAKMGKVMRHTLGASLNIRHNLSSSKGPKPLQLKLLTTYIPKTSAFTLAFSTSQRLRTTRASRSEERFSRNAETDLVCRLLLEKKKTTNRSHPVRAGQEGPGVRTDRLRIQSGQTQ